MAEFCNKCAEEWEIPEVDINVYSIYRRLNKGTMESVLCEGCGLRAISKDQNGVLKVSYINDSNKLNWKDYQ